MGAARRPEFLFHFTTREAYEAILAVTRIATYPNQSIDGRRGISFTDLDPRVLPWQRISRQNWRKLRPWQMEAYIAVLLSRVRKARHVPRTHEWVTTHSVRLGPGCFGGLRRGSGYAADPRPGAAADRRR